MEHLWQIYGTSMEHQSGNSKEKITPKLCQFKLPEDEDNDEGMDAQLSFIGCTFSYGHQLAIKWAYRYATK